jgi:hypothetical protein
LRIAGFALSDRVAKNQRGSRDILPGSVQLGARGQLGQHRPRGPGGQLGYVALPAQVKLHQVLQPPRRGLSQHLPQQGGRLGVGQVAAVAQDAGDQVRRPATGIFQLHIVVELQGQQIEIGQGPRQFPVPAAQVRRVAQRAGVAEQVARPLQSEAEGLAPVVRQRQRPAVQAAGQDELLAGLVEPQQARRPKAVELCPPEPLARDMAPVTVERDPPAQQVLQGRVPPVVAVRVRQHGGVDVLPRHPDAGQPAGELPGPEADIQQDAEAVGLQQAGVARAAARQHRKPKRHEPVLVSESSGKSPPAPF